MELFDRLVCLWHLCRPCVASGVNTQKKKKKAGLGLGLQWDWHPLFLHVQTSVIASEVCQAIARVARVSGSAAALVSVTCSVCHNRTVGRLVGGGWGWASAWLLSGGRPGRAPGWRVWTVQGADGSRLTISSVGAVGVGSEV